MKRTLMRLGLATFVAAALVGCGGGGGGGGGTSTGSGSGTTGGGAATSGTTSVTTLSTSAISTMSITGSVQSVAINSAPVVTFQLINSDNNTALEGVDQWKTKRTLVKSGVANQTGGTTDNVAFFPNVSFAIAKLVPGTNGSPNKWVSYMVSTPTIDSSGNVTGYTAGRPGSENNGTMEYLGNGQYKYTFRRDITQVASQIAATTDSSTNKKADLGDLAYDSNQIHRLVIQISGAARGSRSSSTVSSSTYCNTADGTCPDGVDSTPYTIVRTPADIVFDWIPATGRVVQVSDTDVAQREIVNVAACASCHNKFTFHGGDALTGVGGGRQETRQCVVCHTDQRKFGRTGTTTMDASGNFTSTSSYTINGISTDDNHSLLDFPVMIHKIHMGEELVRTGYNIVGVLPNEIRYPQLITNCAKCHSGDTTKPDGSANIITKQDGSQVQMATVQGNNWITNPSRLACGACHDGINYNTGMGTTLAGANTGHGAGGVGGAQSDDSKCSSCHTSDAIKKAHVSVTPQDRNSSLFGDCATFSTAATCNGNTNAAWLSANPNNLPDGAIKVTYDIKSVSRNSSKQPVMVFRILQNGARVDFNAAPTGKTDAELSNLEILPNFMGSPSAYFVWAVPQDGIAAPADFNASASGYLRSIWNGKAATTGTLTGPDADGYYTVTLIGVQVPDSAVMLTGGLGYTYAPAATMPLTQTNLIAYPVTAATANGAGGSLNLTSSSQVYQPNKTGGLIVVAPDVQVVASAGAAAGGTGGAYAGRRVIVEDKRCNNCHQELGVFNESQFHAGQRNDGSTCSWCHTPNRTSSGWSADSTNFIHAVHGALKRQQQFTWHAASTTEGYWSIGYPGVLKNCEACHVPGSYDFSNPANLAAASKKQPRYTATGIFNGTAGVVNKSFSGTTCTTAGTTVQTDVGAFSLSPWLPTKDNSTFFGLGFSFNSQKTGGTNTVLCDLAASPTGGAGAVVTVTPQSIRDADAITLIETPLSTVCFACHDSNVVKPNIGTTAKAHMEANGGKLYAQRGVGNPPAPGTEGGETCLTTCHNPSAATNIKAAHSK